jgi:hypothetical protein
MKKFSLLTFLAILLCSASFTQSNFQKNAEKEIMDLIQQHKNSFLKNDIIKIFEMNIRPEEEDPLKTGNKDILFYYMAGSTLRFYVLAQEVDTQIQLWQRKDGILEKKNEKLLWKVNKNATEREVSFYDYKIEKENDFILKFRPINNKNKGRAILIAVVISKKGHQFYDTSQKDAP